MKNKKKSDLLTLIVPCYNEEEVIDIFYNEVTKALKSININYELLFINDGSADKTLQKIENIAKEDKKVLYISFTRNFGKEAAMYSGLQNANGNYVGFIDADLQHPPVLIGEMIEKLQSGEYDCVATRRIDRKGDSKIRTFFARWFYKIINKMSDVEIVDGAGDFRIMNKNMVDAILSMSEYNRFSKGIFSWVGFNTYWIEYENVDRVAGKTSWSFFGLLRYAIDGIVSFSNVPLDIASWAGLLMTIFAFIYLLFIIIKYAIYGDPVQGWATTICIILIMGGIQLFALGVIGQYIGKTYLEVKNRPHYVISKSNIKKDIKNA